MTRMTDDEWLPQARAANLKDGQSIRGDHLCGDPGSLSLTREGSLLRGHCFRCGAHASFREQESLADKLRRVQAEAAADSEAVASVSLPEPRVYPLREWPTQAALWLYKMGFSPRMIEDMGIYWCPRIGRVVVPIMQDGHAVFWQARAVSRMPKWIGPKLPRQGLVVRYSVGRGDTIVLCEDMLSAHKVAQVTEAWPLLGTKLQTMLGPLLDSGKRVAVWLDNDVGRRGFNNNPGQNSAKKILATLRAYGIDARNIVTDKDPKWYNREFIREKLCLSTSS